MGTPSAEQELQGFWKSRIVSYSQADPNDLIPNPDNFKVHPNDQAELIDDVLEEIGWIQSVIVNVRTNHIIDGHLRVVQAIKRDEPTVPVTWVDIEPDEEAKAIALFDPTSQLAKQNREVVLRAIAKITSGSKNIQAIIDRIAHRSKLPIDKIRSDMEDEDDDLGGEDSENEVVGEGYRLILGDCLDMMANLPDDSVDCVITDLPYNVTQAEWDELIPLEEMWKQINRVAKDFAMIVLFSAQPFTTLLIGSNHEQFKYEIVWVKNIPTGFLNSRIRPLSVHENICVFTPDAMWYNPQMAKGELHQIGGKGYSRIYGKYDGIDKTVTDEYFPEDVIYFDKGRDTTEHPSEKPVDLMEYLVRSYSNPDDVILDFTMGSGSTGVAALNCGRRFIGIDNDARFFEIAKGRIESVKVGHGES